MIDIWDELVAGALVGTDRRPPDRGRAAAGYGAVGAALAGFGPRCDPLDAAAVVWAYREAGRLPPAAASPPPPPAGPDDRPLPSAGAVGALRAILEHPAFAALLGEWLALAERAGTRLPPPVVPEVFDAAPPGLRPIAARLAGPLGVWLAARNPDWAWAAAAAGTAADPEELERRWHEESDAARLAAWAELRGIDADRARRLVAATWPHDPPAIRLAILDLVARTVDPDDETLLEMALGERRRDIRRRAADLLGRLPDSAWASRVAARCLPLVRVEGRLRPQLRLEYPTELDRSMVRDGIEPPPTGWGERQWWLRQLVAGTPLDGWVHALGRSPGELVKLAVASTEPVIALTSGWVQATASQGRVDWARALLPVAVTKELLAVLPGTEADAVVVDRLAHRGLGPSLSLLAEGPLSPAVSRAVIDALATMLAWPELTEAITVRAQLDRLARSLDVAVAEGAVATLGAALDAIPPEKARAARVFWDRPLGALMATVNFRRSLWAELA